VIDLVKRGHTLGGGMITPDKKYFYLNIPKNASTFTNNVLNDNGWEFWNISDGVFKEAILILRDPVERWISGITTYINLWILYNEYNSDQFITDYNKLVERFIFDTVVFDDHTMPQSFFINNIPAHITKHYVWANRSTLVDSISTISRYKLLVNLNTFDNSKELNPGSKQLDDFIRSKLTPELISKIQQAYKEDYNLINSVNIHGK
jgi:hypothetical protein